MNKIEYIWLSNLDISYKNKIKLIKCHNGIEDLYNSNLEKLLYYEIKKEIAYKVLDKSIKEKACKDYEYLKRNNIVIVYYKDEDYPYKFRNIKDKPICLYIKGNKKCLNDYSVGIVGSRIALKESLEVSRIIANIFAYKGINVISGLAKGIDKYAHLGALDAKGKDIGKTIGIIASGLDKNSFYPQENFRVYERIIESGGAVISEYPIGTSPKSYFFPYRNRLISGLSEKIFVIQASTIKSGSMITVDYALDQGKEIYVYKSKNYENTYFSGNKYLIEEGAKILKI